MPSIIPLLFLYFSTVSVFAVLHCHGFSYICLTAHMPSSSTAQRPDHNLSQVQCLLVHRQVRLKSLRTLKTFLCCMNNSVRHHLYAYDMLVYTKTTVTDVDNARTVLQDCISHVNCWCMSRRLLFNSSKTELIRFESKASLAKLFTNRLDL